MRSAVSTIKPRRSFNPAHGSSCRSFSNSTSQSVVLGIRREDPKRIWERRCPVTPDAVESFVREGVEVLVQPCDRRVWKDEEFIKAGATIHPNLAPANILVGIKETPIAELDKLIHPINSRERTHLMFSHTAKGQLYNMPLLSRFTEASGFGAGSTARLIDYELLVGSDGKRTVGFGWFAGAAGLIEGLSASALDFLSLGVSSPFLYLPRPYSHPSLDSMRKALRMVGDVIASQGMPHSTGPYIIAVTGNGNVAAGALDLLGELPIVYVTAEDLPSLISNPDTDLTKLYVIHVPSSSYLFRKDGKAFNRAEYYATPENFESQFCDKIAPYISLLINGAGWQDGFPRLISSAELPLAIQKARSVGIGRFRTIADISCDVGGGIEFVDRMSTIDDPFFYTDGTNYTKQAIGNGIQVMSIDILPSELPLDASKHFSKVLHPYLSALIGQYSGLPMANSQHLLTGLDGATIAREGKLEAKHTWLLPLMENEAKKAASVHAGPCSPSVAGMKISGSDRADLDLNNDLGLSTSVEDSQSKGHPQNHGIHRKRVLLLGSGMVAKPAVEEFLRRSDINLVVASNNTGEAQDLVRGRESATAIRLDVADLNRLRALVENADIVVSLLPASLHPRVAEICIDKGKNLVTASYISKEMQDLHSKAESAGVLLLNEIGLDPGIDHCSAIDMRTRIEAEGRKVVSFVSWCGGLPAPEDSNVPLGMKFSWSPRGLLTAALNDARFKLGGKTVKIPGSDLLSSHFKSVPLYKGLALEGLANRDSLPYSSLYGLGPEKSLDTLFRGTLRYQGFSRVMDIFRRIGLLTTSNESLLLKQLEGGWYSLLNIALRRQVGDSKGNDTVGMLRAILSKDEVEEILPILHDLALIPSNTANGSAHPALPPLPSSILDLFTNLLSHKLRYSSRERDMVILSHEMISVPATNAYSTETYNTTQALTHTSNLIVYGSPDSGSSAMSQTVGLPLAFAALRVLDGTTTALGVKGPCDAGKEIWGGVLEGLEKAGLGMKEYTRGGSPSRIWG